MAKVCQIDVKNIFPVDNFLYVFIMGLRTLVEHFLVCRCSHFVLPYFCHNFATIQKKNFTK